MTDAPDLRSIVDAAAQAGSAGDYVSAEPLLREVARLQEASLGPLHPDLANTLNNLGVVCEILGKPADAERYFRRACEIAVAALPPDHPFVATSRKNLEDFCAARGTPVDWPTSLPAAAGDRDERARGSAGHQPEPTAHATPPSVVSRGRFRSVAIGAAIAGGLFVTFLATTTWFRPANEVEPSRGRPAASPPGNLAGAPSRPAEPIPTEVPKEVTTTTNDLVGEEPGARSAATTTAGQQVVEAPSVSPAAAERRATPTSAAESPVAAGARLCTDLSTAGRPGESGDWQCTPPDLPVGPGPLFFYTRIKSPTDTTVQHRWYRGDRLRQRVELRIRANMTGGYRTYSRATVNAPGDWRVELRTGTGVLLHEEHFVVR